MDQPLHLKYRPKDFTEFVGNSSVVKSLSEIVERKEGIPHAFLFKGPSGCGKTTLARILKNKLGCGDRDFHEFNVANTRGIDTIREIINICNYAPLSGKVRIFLLDESHRLTSDAQNALLKILEDTPDHVYFILCTTDPGKLIPTIRNRCHSFEVKRLNRLESFKLIDWVCEQEGWELSTRVKREIYTVAEGCPRQILVTLDMIIGADTEEEALDIIRHTSVESGSISELARILMSKNSSSYKWGEVVKVLSAMDVDAEEIRRGLCGYFAKVLLNRVNGDSRVYGLLGCFLDSTYDSGKAGLVYQLYTACLI